MAPGEKAVLAPKGLAERTHSDALDALGAPRPRFRGEGPLTRRSLLRTRRTRRANFNVDVEVQPPC